VARFYDVVCLRCGEVIDWCKYDPPFKRCPLCNARLTDRSGDWAEGRVRVFGVGSGGREICELSRRLRMEFLEGRGGRFMFRLEDGRLCTLTVEERSSFFPEFTGSSLVYRLALKVGGERVSLLYEGPALSEAVHLLRNYSFAPKDGLLAVEYRGKRYHPQHRAAETVLKAVKENVKPEFAALLQA